MRTPSLSIADNSCRTSLALNSPSRSAPSPLAGRTIARRSSRRTRGTVELLAEGLLPTPRLHAIHHARCGVSGEDAAQEQGVHVGTALKSNGRRSPWPEINPIVPDSRRDPCKGLPGAGD